MSAARDTVIALAGVRYSYDAGATWTLDGVDLTVRAGERVALAGANGSGKSTLARVMAGLAAPDHGTVELMGRRVFDDAVGARPDAYRAATRAIGMVFQNPEDQIVTTVTADDVAFGPENLDVAPALIGGRVRDALDAVDMDGWQEADPTRLSGGQQQRIAIAGMLAMDSRVLILDEPTAMLDPAARADVLRTLDTIQARGTAIVLITHHPDERLRADRVVTLAHGRVVSDVPGGGTGRAAMPTETHAGTTAPIDRTASGAVTVDGSADGAPIIAFDHVTFAYPGETAPVLDDFTCAIGRGRIVAVTGPNGWGKTTFARLLTGLERAQAGTVTVDGIDVGHARRARRRALRRTVGFVMQRPERQLFADTVAQDVAFGPANQKLPREEVGARVRDALAFVGLEDMAQRSPFELSGGQQRLAAIAGVLACEPRVLVMDEPTASLDDAAAARLEELMARLRARGVTIVLITHDLALAGRVADGTLAFAPRRADGERAAARSAADGASSPVARLDPRAKMAGMIVFMFSMFAMATWPQLTVGLVVTLAFAAASRLGVRRLWRSVRVFVALFACTGLLNLAVVHEGRVLCTIVRWQVTSGAVDTALLYTLRFCLVVVCGAVVLETTTPTAITNGFESLMRPLKRWLHVQEIALVMSLALRFVPTLAREAGAVRDAQAARGGAIETGSPAARVRAMCAIIVPVFAGAIRHAHGLALALDARCYQEGMPRSQWHALRMRPADWAFLAAIALAIGAVVVLRVFSM